VDPRVGSAPRLNIHCVQVGPAQALASVAVGLEWRDSEYCYIICLRPSVDLFRYPGGPRQLLNPKCRDTLSDRR